jgi:hypothetical protein
MKILKKPTTTSRMRKVPTSSSTPRTQLTGIPGVKKHSKGPKKKKNPSFYQ